MPTRIKAACALIFALAFMAGSFARAAPEPVVLVVEARYVSDSQNGEKGLIHGEFPIERPVRPFRKLAAIMMKYAGNRLAREGDAGLHIEALGVAHGTLYDYMENRMRLRHLRFTGATIEGVVRYESAVAGVRCTARFYGAIPARKGIPIIIGRDYREQPQFAPFEAALLEPGSFVAALAAIIGAVYGAEPLIAAGADGDNAMARRAQAALDGLGGEILAAEKVPAVDCVTL